MNHGVLFHTVVIPTVMMGIAVTITGYILDQILNKDNNKHGDK